jgi:hypothetical protein
MKAASITAEVAAALLIPGLAACGGSKAGTGSSRSAQPSKAASAPSGTLTPPGTKLAVSETATVGWVLHSLSEKAKNGSKLQVTLVSIDKGSIADVNKVFSLSAGEKRDTAYYARFRIKALEDVPSKLTKGSNPAVNIFAVPEGTRPGVHPVRLWGLQGVRLDGSALVVHQRQFLRHLPDLPDA